MAAAYIDAPDLTAPADDRVCDRMRFLETNSPFAGQPPELLRWLAERFQEIHYRPGDIIVKEAESGDALFIVLRGCVSLISLQSDDVELRIDSVAAGDCFGEQAIMTGAPHAATATAVEATDVLRLCREDVEAVLAQHEDCARKFAVISLKRQRPMRIAGSTIEGQQLGHSGGRQRLVEGHRN